MITLQNGNVQNPSGLMQPNGSITFQLNIDATIIASPHGIIPAELEIAFQFDAAGNLVQPAKLYSNAELNPQNSIGLGTYYLVTFYDQNGARLNTSPMWWQFTEAANATVDISAMTPYATVGGNVIFYPTNFALTTPGPATLGGIFSNAGSSSHWVSSINTDGSVTLTQPSFADISGTINPAQLPAAGSSVTYSGTVTAQSGLVAGLVAVAGGQLFLVGFTSGTSIITGPAIAGVPANPFLFSNGVNIPVATIFSIGGDTGISRDSAGVLDVGNGSAGDKTGTINATTANFTGTATIGVVAATGAITATKTLTTPTQPTFRLVDSELSLGNAVTSVSGSVASVRGNTTVLSGTTITGASYLYGTQGKLTVQGALNSSAEVSAGIVGQLDLSTASASSAPIAAGWFDCGATASAAIVSSPGAIDGIVIYNTTNAVINSVIRTAVNANFLFDASDLAFGGQHFVQLTPVNTGDLANVKLAVKVGGVTYYLPLYTA